MWLQRTRDVQRRSTARRWRQRRRHTLIHIRQTTLHVGFYREIVKCVRKRGRRAIKWVGSSRRQQIKTAPTNAKSSRYLFFFLSGRLFLFYESAFDTRPHGTRTQFDGKSQHISHVDITIKIHSHLLGSFYEWCRLFARLCTEPLSTIYLFISKSKRVQGEKRKTQLCNYYYYLTEFVI